MKNNNLKRNKPCFCGSGNKYKNCHANKTEKSNLWLFIIIPIALFAFYLTFYNNEPKKTDIKSFTKNQDNVFSQPNSMARPGKVWSSEHNHWHDAPPNLIEKNKKSQVSPQPEGTPPLGKVWSPEHNHWHDESTHK